MRRRRRECCSGYKNGGAACSVCAVDESRSSPWDGALLHDLPRGRAERKCHCHRLPYEDGGLTYPCHSIVFVLKLIERMRLYTRAFVYLILFVDSLSGVCILV